MSECCVLLFDHLKENDTPIKEEFTPALLALNDKELSFDHPIYVQGSGYLAEDHIVIQLNIKATAYLPCSVCNQPVTIPLALHNAYITKPLSDLSGGKLHFKEDLRELILLEIPLFIECKEGQCPERVHIEKYLKQHAVEPNQKEDDVYYPFDGLDEQLKKH
jgi:uncharacterized metal-binding protein YceD (DUF177 family)